MLKLYERLAINIKSLEPVLSIIAVVLFFGTFVSFHILPLKPLFIVVLIMLWVGGIALIGHMFAPRIDHDGNQTPSRVRESSGFMRGYAMVFIGVWFLGLLFISIKVFGVIFG